MKIYQWYSCYYKRATFRNTSGRTALHVACSLGFEPIVRVFLDEGACVDYNVDDESGNTPIFEAATSGHQSTLQLLLEKHAVVDMAIQTGKTPLFTALTIGHLSIAKQLLEREADINAGDGWDGRQWDKSFEWWKMIGPFNPVVRRLVDNGADPNYRFDDGTRPIHCALETGCEGAVRLLVEKGADASVSMLDGSTPLHQTCRVG